VDIPLRINRWPRRLLAGLLFAAAALVLTLTWNWLAARLRTQTLNVSEVVIGMVEHGTLIRDVRAPGLLAPLELRWIAAPVEGRVENILAEAGATVVSHTIILQLSNPSVSRDADMASIELEVLRAEAHALEQRLINDLLAQEAVVSEYAARHESARYRMEANRELGGIVAKVDLNESILLTRQYEERLAFEQERLLRLRELQEAELAASAANITRAERQLLLRRELQESLTVTAGITGTLQIVPVEIGQLVASGTPLARVAREDRFKAELRVQEGQARELRIGQKVRISAGGQHANGAVSRIDPAVQQGTVLVDVSFVGAALPGARPDLRVQGVIEIDQVEDALVLPRPVYTQENTTADLFVLAPDGQSARRVAVELGLGSVDRIQVIGGVSEGERVIVSDMSRFAEVDSIRLEGVRP
jgi:HlyD family secretion protein